MGMGMGRMGRMGRMGEAHQVIRLRTTGLPTVRHPLLLHLVRVCLVGQLQPRFRLEGRILVGLIWWLLQLLLPRVTTTTTTTTAAIPQTRIATPLLARAPFQYLV